MKKLILNPISMFIIGLIFGALAKILDLYTNVLGRIFSEFSIWILIGTLIAIYSNTQKSAALNTLPFCAGMLITYYYIAHITNSVYGYKFIVFWSIIAGCSPLLAWVVWLTKENGVISKLISVSVLLFSIISTFFVFGIHLYDFLINGLLIYFLFFAKTNRRRQNECKNN